jgi:hypothetical protein
MRPQGYLWYVSFSLRSCPIDSILHMERRAVLGLALAPVIETRSRDIGVLEPFLDLRDIGLVGERVRRRRRPQGVHTKAIDLEINASLQPVADCPGSGRNCGLNKPPLCRVAEQVAPIAP